MSNPINRNQLKAGVYVWVKGQVTFSRITKFIEGEALQKENQRRANRGLIPANRPYTTISISNAQIIPKNTSGLNMEEQYVQNKFYTKADAPNVFHYAFENKSPYLPRVCVLKEGTKNSYVQINPEGELDNGLNVILIMETFASKQYGNTIGLGLNQIMVTEPIRYYSGASVANAMAERGMTYTPLTPEEDRKATGTGQASMDAQATQPQPMAPAQAAPQTASAAPAMTVPTPAPAPVPTPTPFMNMPEPAPAPAQAAPPSPWICSVCGATVSANMAFCGNCGHKKEETAAANAAGNTAAYGGLVYDPQS